MQTFNDFVEDVKALPKGTKKTYPKLLNGYALLVWFKDPLSGNEIQEIAQIIEESNLENFTLIRL